MFSAKLQNILCKKVVSLSFLGYEIKKTVQFFGQLGYDYYFTSKLNISCFSIKPTNLSPTFTADTPAGVPV